MPESLTIKETAKYLGCCRATVGQLMREDETFPYIRVSPRRIIIPYDLLVEWVKQKACSRDLRA